MEQQLIRLVLERVMDDGQQAENGSRSDEKELPAISVSEALQLKRALEISISQLVTSFEQETGLFVDDLSLRNELPFRIFGGEKEVHVCVHL